MKSTVFYHGPSMIDGEPIIGVITYSSKNAKTGGNLAQTWILPADVKPNRAQQDGRDVSVCGDCPLRPILAKGSGRRPCYVKTFQAPRSVWEAFQRGSYPVVGKGKRAALAAGRMVRLGSYGNPSAIPASVWRELLQDASGWTGYDHLWQSSDDLVRANSAAMRQWCMASVETPALAEKAQSLGWRTFRVRLKSEPVLPRERVCPASKEAGATVTCDTCRACSGALGRGAQGIAIIQH